jgi:1-acyl-sn-glycerol-3-phosphate acyltransferase
MHVKKSPFSQRLAKFILQQMGWTIEIQPTELKKYVVIGAPHTSSLDFFFTILFIYASGIKLNFVSKDTLFRWPLGGIMRRLGGIPVNRRARNNFVQQTVDEFNQREKFILAISPEGTRRAAEYWKTGIYYIALGAKVPVALGFIDYGRKAVGIGPMIFPSGDLAADFLPIQVFYTNMRGRYLHRQGEVKIRP